MTLSFTNGGIQALAMTLSDCNTKMEIDDLRLGHSEFVKIATHSMTLDDAKLVSDNLMKQGWNCFTTETRI